MNNQFWLWTWVSTGFQQGFTWKTVNDTINNIDSWQEQTKQKYNNQKTESLENQAKIMYECAMRTNDGNVRKQNLSGANLSNMELIIKQAAKEHWSNAYDDLGEGQILCKFMQDNPQYEKISNGTLWWDVNLKTRARYIGADTSTPQTQSDWWLNKAIQVGIWVASVPAWIEASNLVWKWMQWWGKQLYNIPIDPSIREAEKIQSVWVWVKDAQTEVKLAKNALKEAEKSGIWIEKAQKALTKAEEWLKAAKGKSVRTVADSAMDKRVWKWILEWWTAESRWIQAGHEANQIFKQTINPALEKSTAKVNVQNLINELSDDVERLAKNDPDKLKAYNEALDSLKDSYKDAKYSKYSMKDTQTLKSWLQWRTPQKHWKGKEVTNELQELKWILSTKLKNVIHSNLTKEIWEDSAKMYLDYANLSKYADDMAKSATNSWLKWWAWSFLNTVFHKLTDWAFAKVWLTLDKGWKLLQWPRKILSDGIKYISNNYQKVFKPSTAWKIRVTDPVWMLQLMQAWWELRDSMLWWNTTYWDIADAIWDIPVIQAYDTLSAISEMKSFRDDWNSSDDNGRIDILLDTLWEWYSRKDAENYYKFWKEQQWSKDWTIQSWMWNPLSKSMPA